MIGALALLLLAFVLMCAGQSWLPRARWPQRAPRLAIAVWQTLAGSVIASLALACLALTIPGLSAASTLGEVLRACVVEISRQYSTPGGALMSTLVLVALVVLMGRVSVALWRQRRESARSRGDHVARLSIVSEQSDDGVFVLDHPSALVYCVPGRGHGHPGDVVVMTRTAREALTDEQLELVLSHERAHLRSRHGKLVERSRALASALPFLPFFRVAHEQIAELAEMHADDAVEPDHRRALADALYRLSVANRGGTLPSGTLGAAGPSVVVRARRLLLPREPLKHTVVAVIAAMIVGIATAPLALAFLPAGTGISHDCCVVGVEQTAAEEIPAPVRIAGLRVRL